MTFQPIRFSSYKRASNREGIVLVAAIALENSRDPARGRGNRHYCHEESTLLTFSTVTQDTRVFDSFVTPAMCGVWIRFGAVASLLAATWLSGSSEKTSNAAPPS